MLKLITFLLIVINTPVFADTILLTGRPVQLIPNADYYTFPKTYTPINNYHFVEIGADRRVCFLNARPELKPLDLLRIYIMQNDKKFLWYCYRYNPQFFSIDF